MLVVILVFGCAKGDPQASLAIQIVKDSAITRIRGFGQTVEQYFMAINKHDLQWKAEKKVKNVYVVTMTDSVSNYAEWEVNVKTQDISWPRIGVIRNGKRVLYSKFLLRVK